MTKYDKSIIYKLCCKDLTIQDIYIGSTVNFRNRKYEHKKICNNDFYKDYTNYKYDFIRNNGGWDNWDMIQIKEFPCNSKRELEAEERKVYEELKPTLNTIKPFTTKEEKLQYCKKWSKENKDARNISLKKWRENKGKEYNKKNLEKHNKYHLEYYHTNKEKINEKSKTTIECECGAVVRIDGKKRHERSKKHKNYLTTL